MSKEWFRFAVRDLKHAKALLHLGPEFKHGASFHSQQCAEKAIKGYLSHHNVRPPKTHDIETLGTEVAKVDPILSKLTKKYGSLTDLAVAYRYPDAEKKPLTFTRAKSAVNQAQLIYDECYKRVYGKLPKNLKGSKK